MVDITVVLDRSGSMQTRKDDTIGAFNEFLQTQKKNKEPCHLTLVQFDHEYAVTFEGNLQECPELTKESYVPRGRTALLNAVNRAIAGAKTREADTYLVITLTDGQENYSKEIDAETLTAVIEEQQALGWEFEFLGIAMDQWGSELQSFFLKLGAQGMTYDSIGAAYESVGKSVTRSRTK